MASEILEIPDRFYAFDPQLNTFMSVGILLKYFRRKFFKLEWSKTMSYLASFTRAPYYFTLTFTYVEG